MLKEIAEKRLHAIREFTELGSGIKIAMRDLELRGAGNLLGAEQHGHMEAVGYDLYCKMLNEAVQEAKESKYRKTSRRRSTCRSMRTFRKNIFRMNTRSWIFTNGSRRSRTGKSMRI